MWLPMFQRQMLPPSWGGSEDADGMAVRNTGTDLSDCMVS